MSEAIAAQLTVVRRAEIWDISRITEMVLADIDSGPYHELIKPSITQIEESLSYLLAQPTGLVLIAEEGELATGTIAAYGHNHPISGEYGVGLVFWWVRPENRNGKGPGLPLLRALEHWARINGAKWLQMVAPTEEVAKLYEALGYKYVESAYQRRLN